MLSMGKTWFNIVKNLIILLQLDLKHITRVKFYPSDNNFVEAMLMMLVTNITSAHWQPPDKPIVPPLPPQSNSVRVVSEGSDPVSPTLSKAIEAYFVDE